MSAAAPPIRTDLRADGPASAPAHGRGSAPSARARRSLGGRGPVAVRLVACLALAAFGAQAWGDMVSPSADGRMLLAVLLGGALAGAALLAADLPRPRRGVALAAVAAAGVLAALLCAGVSVSLLGPRAWRDLLGGLGQGLGALPSLTIPYRGVDPWNHVAVLLCGTLLCIAGLVLATWPGRRLRATGAGVPAVILGVLYAVPAVQLTSDHPFFDGAVFMLLLAAVLFGEHLTPSGARVAVPVVCVAALVGLTLAPKLDAQNPWIDYESIAQSLGERNTTAFDWNHGYGPLDWPRDGREVLRVRSRTGFYWKATTLDDFDGVRWRQIRPQAIEDDPAARTPQPKWVHDLRVSIRNLRTRQFLSAGTTLRIQRSPRRVVPGAPGSYMTDGRPLRRGHAYLATVYSPKPSLAQLQSAGDRYPGELWPYLSMQLPRSVGGPDLPNAPGTAADQSTFVVFPAYGGPGVPMGFFGRGFGRPVGGDWVQASAYARMYRLAQQIKAQSSTPYDYIRRVQEFLSDGFAYTEKPPARRVPLEDFVFRDKVGYCQQFSGAMALLLRMGGVPARVASGFTPGTYDGARHEWVVRDIDAHSWVEAYFPNAGWITFDPTPTVAPPRSQAPGIVDPASPAADTETDDTGTARAERGSDPRAIDAGKAAAPSRESGVLRLVGLAILGAGLLAVGGLLVLARRRRAAMTVDDHVRELDRALRRSGRSTTTRLTLAEIEERMRTSPDARAYVRRLRDARFGWGAALPSRAERAALRRELAAGLGVRGRLRALWALPPW